MEAQRAGHTWQERERWGFSLQQGIPGSFSSCLSSSQSEAAREENEEAPGSVCLHVTVTMGWVCAHGLGGVWDEEEWRKPKHKSPALFSISVQTDKALTPVTEGWCSIRMICVCHISWWKHPEHWWLWRVHAVGRQVVNEDINMREILKIILFFRQKCTAHDQGHCMYFMYISCSSVNGP